MKIVVLDAKPFIKDDLDLSPLKDLGEVLLFEQTSNDEQILERASAAEILLVNKIQLTDKHFKKLPQLKYIGLTATGVDNIDLLAAEKRGILVSNVPSYATDSVAQHVIALILRHCNQVDLHHQSITKGDWQREASFSYWLEPIVELSDLTLGLLGFGQIAQKVAKIAKALGMSIISYTPSGRNNSYANPVSLTELFQKSDFLSLHCPLNPKTQKIINRETLKHLKSNLVLINTSRGALIDEEDLAQALKGKQLAPAYLDVLSQEPPPLDHPLLALKNCILTPHMAWSSLRSRKRLLNTVCENIIRFLNREPINIVHSKHHFHSEKDGALKLS